MRFCYLYKRENLKKNKNKCFIVNTIFLTEVLCVDCFV